MDESEILLTSQKQAEIVAKREARKKRILENTNNRLEKITGRPVNEEMDFLDTSIPNIIYPDPDIEREVFESSITSSPEFDMFSDPNGTDIMKIFESLRQQSPQFNNNNNNLAQPQSVHQTKLVKLLKTKIHIALISIIIYILFVTENQSFTSNSVFLYLLVWEFAEVFLLKSYESKNSFISIVFLFGGISIQYLTHVLKIIETVNKILKDVAIFIFFFVGSHIFWQSLFLGKEFNEIINKEDFFHRL